MVFLARMVHQVSMDRLQLEQVLSVHEVLPERKVRRVLLESAFRVKSDHVENLASLEKLVFQVS